MIGHTVSSQKHKLAACYCPDIRKLGDGSIFLIQIFRVPLQDILKIGAGVQEETKSENNSMV
jgi:hypothetical protein